MRYLLIFILCLPFSVYAELSFKQLEAISTTPEKLQGSFKQEKYLSHLEVSLNSSGTFSYQRGLAIHWYTLEPIQNELIMTENSIINRQGDKELVNLDGRSNPAIALLSEIFFAVLTAQWQQLASHFELSGEENGKQWRAELIPKDKMINQFADKIVLRGDSLLREIVLYESNGDHTTIHFDDLQ